MTAHESDEKPRMAESGVPLWVKVMWVIGAAWVVGYVVLGLRSTPETW
ncbi:MAG: hypothetical protein HYY13_07580 [Nitrospirae bacterium]|nr:hypothetical protein [Nitrospirota bacterium]